MNYLVFDTETNGKIVGKPSSFREVELYPRITHLCWGLFNSEGSLYASFNHLIKPEGWVIPKEAFFIENGHSTERCELLGVGIEWALEVFLNAVSQADVLIAHNMAFDYNVIASELYRADMLPSNPSKKEQYCTMLRSVDLLKLPGNYGYKYPNLQELHKYLFGEGFVGGHDAFNDVMACAKCFFELKRREHTPSPSNRGELTERKIDNQ